MRILQIHNEYQNRGGEDVVVEQEAQMLRARGHEVILFRRSNSELRKLGLWRSFTLPFHAVWASGLDPLRALIHESSPDLVHIHNTFVMISPRAHHICCSVGVPVVQTLHNYRLLCPNADFFRRGVVCEDCIGRTPPLPSIVHACYHNSPLQSSVVAAILTTHQLLRTWKTKVDMFIALTEFAKRKFIQGGIDEAKLVVKPNFVSVPTVLPPASRDFALFVGRLDSQKGVSLLLQAWRWVHDLQLRVVGDDDGRQNWGFSSGLSGSILNVRCMGRLPRAEVLGLMSAARFLVVPSRSYEGFPMVVAEAYASGLPVIASRIGSMIEIVREGDTGLLFTPGDVNDLAAKIAWAQDHPLEMELMGRNARREYEMKYTEDVNYSLLMAVYERALVENRKRGNA